MQLNCRQERHYHLKLVLKLNIFGGVLTAIKKENLFRFGVTKRSFFIIVTLKALIIIIKKPDDSLVINGFWVESSIPRIILALLLIN